MSKTFIKKLELPKGFYVNIVNGTGRSFSWEPIPTPSIEPKTKIIESYIEGDMRWENDAKGTYYVTIAGTRYTNKDSHFKIPLHTIPKYITVSTSGGGYSSEVITCYLTGFLVTTYERLAEAPFISVYDKQMEKHKIKMIQGIPLAQGKILRNIKKVILYGADGIETLLFESNYHGYTPEFNQNSWESIAKLCKAKDPIINTWKIGDSKETIINGIKVQVVIIGKNHDTYSNGKTAPITFMISNIPIKGPWSGAVENGPIKSVFNSLEFKKDIVPVQKFTSQKEGIIKNNLSLFALAESEIVKNSNIDTNGGYGPRDEPSRNNRYEYFVNSKNIIQKNGWWTRSRFPLASGSGVFVTTNGTFQIANVTESKNYSLAFCF